MTVSTASIPESLAQLPIFADLSAEAIDDLAQRGRPLRYRMGQVIMRKEKMSPRVAIIFSGKVRLLGFDSRTEMPITLELLQAGAMLGWVNMARGLPCETAIASTDVVCLTIERADFEQLLAQYPLLKTHFQERPALVEIAELLSQDLAQRAQGEGDLKTLATTAIATAQVQYLFPGRHDLTQVLPTEGDRIWFLSGGTLRDHAVGSRLTGKEVRTIEVQGKQPARLLGLLTATVSPPQMVASAKMDLPNVAGNGAQGTAQLATIPTPAPQPETDPEEIPYAEAELLDGPAVPTAESGAKQSRKHYPFVRGKTPEAAAVACFQMLSQYFNMPFRREVIQRVIREQLQLNDGLSLNIAGAIAELMGLNAQLVNIPAASITRLKAPALVRWQDSLAILYAISDRQLIVGVPEAGILKRRPADFIKTWGAEGQVLLLQPTKETPEERFGLRWFLPALSQYRRVLLEVFIASFFVQMFGLANPLMIQIIIDKVIVQNSPDTLQVLGAFLVFIAIFEALLTSLRTYLFVDTTNRIDMSLGSEIIDHLLRLPLRYFEKRPVGEIATRINELENIRRFLTGTALTVVLDAVFSVVYIVVMMIYSPLLTLVALGIVPIFVIMTLFFSPTIRRQLRTKAERNAQTQSYLVEVMSGIQTVKAQNIELRSRWQWQERYARYVSAGFQTVITQTMASSTSTFLNKLSGLLVLWVGASLVLSGELTLGQLIAFRIISSYVTSPILRLTQLWQNFQETALSLERLADIVDSRQEAEQDRDNIPMPAIQGAVKFENVSFRFKRNGPLQLNNINLIFPVGTFVAIVGQSGAGKSTLTKLLSRLYEPEAGRILVDGYDINKVELYSLRRQIGVVPQEPLLFEGSVQENIALTNPDASTEEVIQAAEVAAAHEFIMTLPNGYNTKVGERGSSLSGGQRQRIAIARSVLQQPSMLVLDEATSALDYATEQQVCHNLIDAFSDRTVFFITHRLSSIRNADTIVMMDAGAVVEVGTHGELMAQKGHYYYLYQQQESQV